MIRPVLLLVLSAVRTFAEECTLPIEPDDGDSALKLLQFRGERSTSTEEALADDNTHAVQLQHEGKQQDRTTV